MLNEACTYVIFGATGNLSRVKLMPALYHLKMENRLAKGSKILAIGRRDWDNDKLITEVREMIKTRARGGLDDALFQRFSEKLSYSKVNIDDPDDYLKLAQTLNDNTDYPNNIAFYLAISPEYFANVIEKLSKAKLLEQTHGWRRMIIEKPFGYDLESSQALQQRISRYLREEQIYRIDHYLGKGTVQNVLVFRFANIMLEPLWNRHYIDHIQITHSEEIGIGTRANYYDDAGAMRDMLQSHLLQLLTLVAMEPPASMDAESLRDEKVKVLKSIRPISKQSVNACTFRAQYSEGMIDGKKVKSYLDEENVPANSITETYAAMKLYVDNWRWRDVPFYLRTGKRMAKGQSGISICFKQPPLQFFQDTQVQCKNPNWLLLGIQPEECIRMEMTVKEPGLEMHTRVRSLDASFRNDNESHTDAYEDLLLDVIEGDHSLFLRFDEVEYAWRIIDPILQKWAVERDFITTYPAGSWGPMECQRLFETDKQYWRNSLTPLKYE